MTLRRILHRVASWVLRIFLTPVRIHNNSLNGVASKDVRMEIPNDILLTAVRDAIREGYTATIMVKGWSMRPFLEHCRDKVLLEHTDNPQVGDAVLSEINPGHFVLHRIICREGDNITLMGDGNLLGTEHCQLKDICGVVTEYIRPNRSIKADDPKLIRKIVLWRKLLPCRKYLLWIYRAMI